jgi:ABC-type polar amino acid transport system ATPase subunit
LVVKISHVHKYFGRRHVLDDVSREVTRGEGVVVIGPSGSGKSRLLRCLNALEPVQSGEIHRVVFMDEGRTVEVGSPEETFDRPRSPRTRAFLSKIL